VGFTENYFTVHPDSSVTFGTTNSNPQWIRDAIVYEIFVPPFSASGTLDAITARLASLVDLGINTLWLMPIMDNLGTINEGNAGYDIVDFYSIEPKLGDLQSFKRLIDSAHARKMRVILDITPNHVSQQHQWVNDIRQWSEYSNFKNFIETRLIGDDRGLGQSVTSYRGQPLYAHYDGWWLANLNLSDEECRLSMMDVYKYWLVGQSADGFRMDVYWGPQNRFGTQMFWRPFREEMKRVKPDMFILGETDGTGPGSENNYADGGGACDAAYDWNLYGQIRNTLSSGNVDALHQRVINFSTNLDYNFYTGPNTHYLRFAENHDETRIAQEFSFDPERTKAAAALLMTIPGIPMLYAGQEIGWKGRRDAINFNSTDAKLFYPFYQRVTRLRSMFPAFRTTALKRVTINHSQVYAFLRPYKDQNIISVISFRSAFSSRVHL
jgi:glycosidase